MGFPKPKKIFSFGANFEIRYLSFASKANNKININNHEP